MDGETDTQSTDSGEKSPRVDLPGAQGIQVGNHNTQTNIFTPSTPRKLDQLADRLAEAVSQQWTKAATARRLLQPEPIALRWTLPTTPVAGSTAAAAASTRFPPLPGFAPTSQDLREGGLHDLHAVYGGLGSGRMMIVGAPGSGKSGAAVLLVLAALRHRDSMTDTHRAKVPVPLLVTPHDWNPRIQRLRDWLVSQLRQTYEDLFAGRRGARMAARLIDEGRITVVVDGLDEMTEQLRPVALQALNEQATFRLVVLARVTETATAAEQAMLDGAYAVELQAVDPTTAADYLTRIQLDPPPHRWRELTDLLRNAPDSPLARTLQNPLTLTLVRDTYRSGDNVGELVDFCTATQGDLSRNDIEDHLLDRVIPQAYAPRPGQPQPRYSLPTAQRTLRTIAALMSQDQTRDLAWWHLPAWAPRLPRILAIGVASGVVACMGGFRLLLSAGLPSWIAPTFVLVAGLGGMLGASLSARKHSGPEHWRFLLRHPALVFIFGAVSMIWLTTVSISWFDIDFLLAAIYVSMISLACWMTVGFAIRLAEKLGYPMPHVRSVHRHPALLFAIGSKFGLVSMFWLIFLVDAPPAIAIGVLIAIVLVFGFGFWSGLRRPGTRAVEPLTPTASWGEYRVAALATWLALGLISGGFTAIFGGLFGVTTYFSTVTTLFGLGLLSGFMLGLIYPETWSTSLAFTQLAARWRTPIQLMRFLDDARERNVLRTVGPVYQFRHARLQDRLAHLSTEVFAMASVDTGSPRGTPPADRN
jgi:hypothetical protein